MALLFRRAVWKLFRVPTVCLIDFDGEPNLRFARDYGPIWTAKRMGLGISTVSLNPDGTCSGASYVKRWILVVGQMRFLPSETPSGAEAGSAVRTGAPIREDA